MAPPRRNLRKGATSGAAGDITSQVDRLSSHFQSEMDKFRKELITTRQLDSASASETGDDATVDELLARFTEFQNNINAEMQELRSQIDSLCTSMKESTLRMDRDLQQSFRNKLLIYGIPEVEKENNIEALMATVVKVVNNQMRSKGVEIQEVDISDCYRWGKKRPDKPRPILVNFLRIYKRNLVYNNKSSFKGSKILIAEYLTSPRFALFKETKRRFSKDCWTRNGDIFVSVNGVRRLIRDLKDLD